ncbi:MAG: carbohydrate kinase [Rhodococcus sp. (in: high G+C Gram-positive bacteria)]|nr:MAG: carbohydrate kinase [Rhodococcus sp. (in: high G+C Gram-positive bacteria)]
MTTTPTSRSRCDIAVVGESLIDTVVAADGTRRERVGGGPATLARGLGRLGMDTTLLTTFGADRHGRAIDHELTRCGVRVIQAGRPAARTSTTITDPDRPGADTVDLRWELAHTDVPACAHLHVGSLAVVRAPGAQDVARLVARQHPDTTISYDVTVRPSAMGPRDPAIARIDEMLSRSDIVKLSEADLAWLRPGERRGDGIRWLMSRGPAILVVTHGDTAATGYTRNGSVRVRGHRVEVADTAEWEDAFLAGLLHALTGRDLLARRTSRRLRTIGRDDLHRILHDATLGAARAVTPAAVRPARTDALAVTG